MDMHRIVLLNIHLLDMQSFLFIDRLCGLVFRVPGYRSRGLGSIPGTTRFSEK
jgi:hypothetical protein